MLLGGFQKLTLIDYPGHLAVTVFTTGCSFRCPFCHSPELVIGSGKNMAGLKEKDFFVFLQKRRGKLTGVCITGGEPTIQPDILDFIKKIKKMGYAVKLDTNGMRPDVLKKAIDGHLVDFIAMDIKNSLKNYDQTAGVKVDKERIKLSVDLLMHACLPYEFRTTVVPGIHTENDFLDIAAWISGARSYWLQKYQEIKILDPKLKTMTKGQKLDLEKIKNKIAVHFEKIDIRG
jgi:pyruvate formate lyase activating enzyme